MAGTIDVAWDPVPGAAGYRVHHGTRSGGYDRVRVVTGATEVRLENLQDCTRHYIAVQAFNLVSDGPLSAELSGWPRPRIEGFRPGAARQGSALEVEIRGANFEHLAEATGFLTDLSGRPLVSVELLSVDDCRTIQARMEVSPPAPGYRAMPLGHRTVLRVRNPDGAVGVGPGLLRIDFDRRRADVNRSSDETRDRVDGSDLAWLAFSYGSIEGSPIYNPDADLDGDGIVDGLDLSLMAPYFGMCWVGETWTADGCD